jgi:hypothetical protein
MKGRLCLMGDVSARSPYMLIIAKDEKYTMSAGAWLIITE